MVDKIKELFPILFSPRFQALVLIAIIYILQTHAILSVEIAQAFYIVLGGSAGIKTIDRFSEKVGPLPQ